MRLERIEQNMLRVITGRINCGSKTGRMYSEKLQPTERKAASVNTMLEQRMQK